MKRVLTLLLAGWTSAFALADTDFTPCLKVVDVDSKIVRLQIPMTPFRGVNLIFPDKLHDNETIYNLSSNKIWNFKKAQGANLVPLYFENMKAEYFGATADLTIAQDGFIYSIALVAKKSGHCSNYKFELSDALQKELDTQRKTESSIAFDAAYEKRLSSLDQQVDQRVLEIVGEVVTSKEKVTRIFEEEVFKSRTGEKVGSLYVDTVSHHGPFNVLSAQFSNRRAGNRDINIASVSLFVDGDVQPLMGRVVHDARVNGGTKTTIIFSSLESIPKTGARLVVDTDIGQAEVTW